MIISTGMADAEEIQEAVDAAREGGCKQPVILHCVSGYPAPQRTITSAPYRDMIERFGLVTAFLIILLIIQPRSLVLHWVLVSSKALYPEP